MKISMNGLRHNIARAFNRVVINPNDQNLEELRKYIVLLLCAYDDNIEDDMDDLSDSSYLLKITK